MDSRPEYTPTEALVKFERDWGSALEGVTLAGELDIAFLDAAELLKVLVRRSNHDPRVLERHPACVVVSMSVCARRIYEGGALWDGLFKVLERSRSQGLEARLGEAFIDALESLEMPKPTSHFRFVAPMALHACIPDYCIGDLLRMLALRQEVSPGIDGTSFISWATGLGGETKIADLDRPVRDFLTTGDDFAIDLVDRTLDLLDLIRRGARDVADLKAGSGAPKRFILEALRALAEDELALGPISGNTRSREGSSSMLPRVALDLDRWCLTLRLPPVGEVPDGRAWWSVTLDEDVRRVSSRPGSGRASGDVLTEMVIDHPVRSLGVALGSSEYRYDLELVDAQTPLLAFDRRGTLLPMGTPLPAGEVWLLHPAQANGAAPFEVLGSGSALSSAIGPIGWHGWDLTQVSLTGARGLLMEGVTRPVRRSLSATLDIGDPLPTVKAADGAVVFPERPRIDIPMTSAARDWMIDVRDATDGSTITSDIWTIPALGEYDDGELAVVDPFEGWPSPIVGSFEVRARGALGTRGAWSVTLCEGLRVVPSVECRSFVSGGLTPMSVRLDATTDLNREPSMLEFHPSDLDATARIVGGSGELSVDVTPAHLEICHASATGTTEWTSQPLTLASDGTDDFGTLEVRMPTQQALPPLLLHSKGMKQTLVSHRGGAFGHHRFELSRLTDTVLSNKSGELRWDFGPDATTTLVRFQPKQLASAMAIESEHLVAQDFAGIPNVVAGIYSLYAPWRDPVVVELNEQGISACPPELVDTGPLRAQLRIDDPWVPAPWGKWNGQGLPISQAGSPTSAHEAEAQVIAYLEGSEAIPFHTASLPHLWSALEAEPYLRREGLAADLVRDIPLVFRGRWLEAVQALPSTRISPELALQYAIRFGLVDQALPLPAVDARALWHLYPAIASLAASRDDAPKDVIATRCGQSAADLLAGDDDPEAASGRFTNSLRMDLLPSSAIQTMLDVGGVVPGALLDSGTRTQNASQLFLLRTRHEVHLATAWSERAIAIATSIIRDSGYPKLAKAIEDRPERPAHRDWQRLPQMSLLLAGLARVGSRGFPAATRALDEMRSPWASMARVAYPFVSMDIILAELLVLGDDTARIESGKGTQTT